MLDVGDKFKVQYRSNTKEIECVVLSGRQFGRLVGLLNNMNSVGSDQTPMFEDYIPNALALVVGDKDTADDLWNNSLTMQDVMEIVQSAVGKHAISGEEGKKSE